MVAWAGEWGGDERAGGARNGAGGNQGSSKWINKLKKQNKTNGGLSQALAANSHGVLPD